MSDFWKIGLSAAGVFALAVAIYFVRLFMDGRRLRREGEKAEMRRQVIQHEKDEWIRPFPTAKDDTSDDTKTWPGPPATA